MGARRVHTILIADFKAVDGVHQSVETTIKAVDFIFACLQVEHVAHLIGGVFLGQELLNWNIVRQQFCCCESSPFWRQILVFWMKNCTACLISPICPTV